MKLTIKGNKGMSWVYLTADEVIFQEKKGEVIVFAKDTDNEYYRDAIQFAKGDDIEIMIEDIQGNKQHKY